VGNFLSKRFPDYFGVGLLAAGALALAFGAMHLFARAMDYVEMLLGNSADIGEIVACLSSSSCFECARACS
jgi:hypothetical protein